MATNGSQSRQPDEVVRLDDVPFEGLYHVLKRGGDLAEWNDRFGAIVAQVGARLRSRFGEADLVDSAAQSAIATLVRRLREGEPDSKLERVDGPDALVGYLVLRAHHKAWIKLRSRWRSRTWPVDWEPADRRADATAHAQEADDSELIRSAVRVEMTTQLHRLLDRMNLLLGTPRQRATFALIYRDMYGVERMTDAAIASRVGVSTKTVQRVRATVEEHRPELEEEGRQAVRALEQSLRERKGS
jgi:DNA-directed RNA polymerase specialized sigma24 family protein